MPKILISDFLKSLRDKFNIGFFINEQNRSVKILSFDSIITRVPYNSGFNFLVNKIKSMWSSGLQFNDSAPDIWSLNPFNSVAELDPYDTLVTYDNYNDLEDAALLSVKALVKSESTYYDVDSIGNITRIGPDLFPYTEGDGSQAIDQAAGTLGLYRITKNLQTEVQYIVPYCDLTGNRPAYEYTPFPLIFLLSRGKQDCWIYHIGGSMDRQYPMGTCDIYDAKGSVITGATLALRYHGTYGIIERFWENRIQWELNRKKLITAKLPEAELSRLIDFTKVINIGNNNYLVNSLEVEATNDFIQITKVELLRL